MAYLILVMILCAIGHFVYESILAPSLRLKLRFKMFTLRDQLRALKITHAGGMDDKHFNYLEDSINTFIGVLHRIDFAMLATAELAYQKDPEFRKRAEERSKILDDCAIAEAREIRRKSLWLATQALLVNSGVVIALTAPIALVFHGFQGLKRKVRTLASISEPDLKNDSSFDALGTAIS